MKRIPREKKRRVRRRRRIMYASSRLFGFPQFCNQKKKMKKLEKTEKRQRPEGPNRENGEKKITGPEVMSLRTKPVLPKKKSSIIFERTLQQPDIDTDTHGCRFDQLLKR